ncbi:MAG: carbohydrate kinase [Bacteroidetes bacterium]|nr:MAG: carbohydrate kinase [Bacteroidota bacterium]PTM13354.1 MAG: carbohydrate kinase [Bacteroidota bacterium]
MMVDPQIVPPLEVLAVGELLIDFISTEYADSLEDATNFKRLAGGSPANMAGNLARLGRAAGLVASVGKDDMGDYLLEFVKSLGLNTAGVHQVDLPSTLILITRSQGVSNFEPYRQADAQITTQQLPAEVLQAVRIFHTTCFALSREPARSAILTAAQMVKTFGGVVSLDANYAAKIWPDQTEAQQVVARYCAAGALVKFSDVDWERLYGSPLTDPAQAAVFLHGLGAQVVCITLGEKGCFVSRGAEQHVVPARPIEVKDTTGAGDAFWAGFLCAFLDDHDLKTCALAGRKLAEMKLQHFGPLPVQINKSDLYLDVE